MTTAKTSSIQELVEGEIPRIRGNANDHDWEKSLFEQVDAMVDRLRMDEPIDIREGLQEGVVVFSIYELLITAGKERSHAGSFSRQPLAA